MLPRDGAIPSMDRSACPSVRGHGTRWHRYRNGCTCPDGLVDERRTKQRLPPGAPVVYKHVSAVGTMRRLQAAACAGYTLRRISADTRIGDRRLADYRHGVRTRLLIDNAEAVARVVDRLVAGPPPHPDDPGAIQSRARAAREGWVPLHEWLDIDDPLDTPDRAYRRDNHTRAALADIRELHTGGLEPAAIAGRTGWPVEDIERGLVFDGAGRPASVTVDRVIAIRAEYVRTRHTSWSGKRVAAREGLTTYTVSLIIHGRYMPREGFTDLTRSTAPNSDGAAHTHEAVPRPAANRKEGSAA